MEEYVRVFKEHGVSITAEEVALYFASKVGSRISVLSADKIFY